MRNADVLGEVRAQQDRVVQGLLMGREIDVSTFGVFQTIWDALSSEQGISDALLVFCTLPVRR